MPLSRDELFRVTKQLNSQYASRGDVVGARSLIENKLLAVGLLPNLVTANTLIKTYRVARQPEGAEAVLRELPGWGLRADGCTFSTLVDAYAIVGRLKDAYRVVTVAEESGVADSRVYSALFRFIPADEVEPLMQHVVKRGVKYEAQLCHAALNTLSNAGRVREMEAYMQQHMSGGNVQDTRAAALLIKAHCAAGSPQAAEEQLRVLSSRGHTIDAVALCTVMNAYVSQSPPDVDSARQLMENSLARGVRADTAMYNTLIKGYAASKPPQPEAAAALLQRIRQVGLQPSVTTLCLVMDAYCERNMVAQAQQLAEEAIREGVIEANEVVFNTLIKAVSRCRCKAASGECLCDVCGCCQPARGIELVEEMARHGLHPDTITINTLLDAHCSAQQLPQAWLLLESLLLRSQAAPCPPRRGAPQGFSPDASTFLTLLHGMLRALQRLPSREWCSPSGCGTSDKLTDKSLSVSWVLSTLGSAAGMICRSGVSADDRLLGALEALCREMHVGWDRSAGVPALQERISSTEICMETLPALLLDDVVAQLPSSEHGARKAQARMSRRHATEGTAVLSPHDEELAAAPLAAAPTALEAAPLASEGGPRVEGASLLGATTSSICEPYVVELTLSVDGLHCAGCVDAAERSLRALPGVATARVSLHDRRAIVTGVHASLEVLPLLEALAASNKKATPLACALAPAAAAAVSADGRTGDGEAPRLCGDERRELERLRRRVAVLEEAIRGVASLV